MGARMIVDYRKKPSLARRKVVAQEKAAERHREEVEALILFARATSTVTPPVVSPEVVELKRPREAK